MHANNHTHTHTYECRQVLSGTYTFQLVPKGHATDRSILCENKTNFPYHKLPYVFMIKQYIDTAIFYFSIYHILLIKESIYFGYVSLDVTY